MRTAAIALSLATIVCLTGGCVRGLVTITSEPTGATVWLNDREMGRTPVEAEFTYYGTYDVRLQRDGYEPLDTQAEAVAPLWDVIGLDFFAEITPAQLKSVNAWHFTLAPTSTDPAALMDRAKEMRDATTPAAPPADVPPVGQ